MKIFSKLDWFSGVFKNVSIAEILDEFSIYYDFDIMKLVSDQYISATSVYGYGADIVVQIMPGINLRIPAWKYMNSLHVDLSSNKEALHSVDPAELILYKWNEMNLVCSGVGLDFLRKINYNADENLSQYFPGIIKEGINSFHVTRADFAFDFIDIEPEFMFKMKEFLNKVSPYGERVFCGNSKTPIIISPKFTAKERTFYFGSTGADKLLRVYDKFLQCSHNLNELVPAEYKEYNESTGTVTLPFSWIRIELQARREVADKLLRGKDPNKQTKIDFEYWDKQYWIGVLRWIFDYYAPKYQYESDPIDCWMNLFDWSQIETIIQISKYPSSKTLLEKAESNFIRNEKSTFRLLGEHGFVNHCVQLNDDFHKMQEEGGESWRQFFNSLLIQKTPGHPELPPYIVYNKKTGYYDYKDFHIIEECIDYNY